MRWIAVIPWVALAVAGCGGERSPASVVPADVPVYVSVAAGDVPRPPGVDVPAQLLVDSLALEGVDYRRDVAPWIGERAAFFSMSEKPDALEAADVLVLAARDENAARAFGDRVRAGGTFRAAGVVDGHLVLATSRDLLQASIDAAKDGALADSGRFDPGDERGDDRTGRGVGCVRSADGRPRGGGHRSAGAAHGVGPGRAAPRQGSGDRPRVAGLTRGTAGDRGPRAARPAGADAREPAGRDLAGRRDARPRQDRPDRREHRELRCGLPGPPVSQPDWTSTTMSWPISAPRRSTRTATARTSSEPGCESRRVTRPRSGAPRWRSAARCAGRRA